MRSGLRHLLLAIAVLLSLALFPPSFAGDGDHDRARDALEAGKILPLPTIITQLEQTYPGQIVEVELEYDDDMWIYEIKLLRTEGTLVKIEIDASDGTLLSIKGRDVTPGPLPQERP